jgi:ribonuclease Y
MDNPALVAGLAVVGTLMLVAVGYGLLRAGRVVAVAAPAGVQLLAPPTEEELEQISLSTSRAEQILADARSDADRILKDADHRAKDETYRRREELNRELEAARSSSREQERRAQKREDAAEDAAKELARKDKALDVAQQKAAEAQAALAKQSEQLAALIQQETKALHDITGLSREAAERTLFEKLQQELSTEFAGRIQKHTELLKATAEAKAREIITVALQRYAAQHTADTTVSTVDIPDDTMKGRIIGREGRNIRTFERCTGVDVIVDDTPGVVVVSAFDNVRRETARQALAKLIQDGRIHPTRIEEIVLETQQEMEKTIQEAGAQAVLNADVAMPHEKIVALLGRLKYRTSYSQNVLMHSLEVAHLCGLMASELGLDPRLARRCGLLHDVGKAADHEMEGGHPKVGAELARRYGETNPDVLHAIEGHHDDITVDHIYTVLVAAADAISASRPGARRETLERYVKRMADLEAVACGFPEVDAAFAIQAGRELRVIANSHRATDADAVRVCREIARAIEDQLDYPGEIKVTVIREMRILELAK